MVEVPNDEQMEHLARWRALALQRMPYFSSLLFAMRPLNVPGTGTFAVDPRWCLYIDFDEVVKHGDLWCSESLLHEAGHLFYDHHGRAKDAGLVDDKGRMDPFKAKVSNLAADAAINDDLVAVGCLTLRAEGFNGAPGGIVPSAFGQPDHETYEFYLKCLLKQSSRSNGGSTPTSFTTNGCGSGSGNLPLEFELPEGETLGGTVVPPTKAERDAAILSTASSLMAHQGQYGTIPSGLAEQAQMALTPPQLRWQDVLAISLRAATNVRAGDEDFRMSRPSRRRGNHVLAGGGKVIFPSTFSPTPTVVVVRDTSGSMSARDLELVSSEIAGISKQMGLRGPDLQLIDVDCQVYPARPFTSKAVLNDVRGRGGTDMSLGIEAAAAMKPKPSVCVVLTDGFTPWPQVRPRGMSVVACIIGSGGSDVYKMPSWIKTVTIRPK